MRALQMISLAVLLVAGLAAGAAAGTYPELDLNTRSVHTASGPQGEKIASPSDFSLTAEEIKKLKDGKFRVAFCYHLQEDQCNITKLAAAREKLESWGIEIVATTNASFVVEQQIADIESVLALKPDVIFTMPIDADALSSVCRKVSESGSKLVFMEMYANNLVAGKDYVGTIANDYYGCGVGAAHMLAKGLGYKGNVAMCFYDANFYSTEQRDIGFKDTIEKYYPDMKIVMEIGFNNQNDTQAQGDAIFARFPDIDGLYTSWDIPMEGLIAAAKSAGIDSVKGGTVDLSDNTARLIAEQKFIVGTAAPRSLEAGQAEAMLAAYALLGKEVPSTYVAVPAQYVMHDNLLEAYETIYGIKAPQEIVNLMK